LLLLRKHTDAVFRIDARLDHETITNAIELKKLGVEFLEQPLKADDWHKEVYNIVLPIIADESCIIETMSCVNIIFMDIKLAKCA
jgi:L-alanine-DL-glutamate epimerase-like enolase superfamily enzyme